MANTLETTVMTKVSSVIGFIKDEVKNNLVEASNRGMIQIDRNTLENRKIINDPLLECKYMKQSFSSELLIRSMKKGYKVKSVPVLFKNRKVEGTGTSYQILPGMIRKSWNGYYSILKEVYS